MANEQKYIPMVGVDMLYYAKVTTDTQTEYAASTPTRVPGLTEAGINPNAQSSTFYADNGAYDNAVALGDLDIAIACADVPPGLQKDLFGYKYDAETGEMAVSDVNPPYVAILYRIQKSNGAYRYVTIYKAKAVPNEEKAQTKGGSINFQSNGFSLKGAKRLSDGRLYRVLDDDDPNLPAGVTPAIIASKWFSDVGWAISAS